MPRPFQFSLRTLLAALTIACLGLGWKVEQARQRGAAIDGIVATGGTVFYELGKPRIRAHEDHFWPDARFLPVVVILPEGLNIEVAIVRYLENAAPIETLAICHPIQDDALRQLRRLNDGCLIFLDPKHLSAEAIEELRRARPKLTISKF